MLSTAQIDWEPAGNLLWKSCNSNFFLLCFKSAEIPAPDIALTNATQHPNIGAQQHYGNQEELYSSMNWELICTGMAARQRF